MSVECNTFGLKEWAGIVFAIHITVFGAHLIFNR